MPVIPGWVAAGARAGYQRIYLTEDLDDYDASWVNDLRQYRASLIISGGVQSQLPVDAPSRAITGWIGRAFSDDYYHRVHVVPRRIDFGNVVGQTTQQVTVWNAHLVARTLQLLAGAGQTDGITLSGQSPPPLSFTALQERQWTVTVTSNGPPAFDATYQWTFAHGEAPTLRLLGKRAVAWSWMPTWQRGVLERLEWQTDVLQAFGGREQRRRLRPAPRRSVECEVLLTGADLRRFETALWGWQARVWALPLWWDGRTLSAAASVGATMLSVSTESSEFAAGKLAILWANDATTEIVEVSAVASNTLTLARPLDAAWPAGTHVYPCVLARIEDVVALERFTDEAAAFRLRFAATESSDVTASAGSASYLGVPVLTQRPRISRDVVATYARKLDVADNATAYPSVEDEAGVALPRQLHGWLATTRAERAALRSLFYWLAGRYRAMWVPTWSTDLVMVAPLGAGLTQLDVARVDYPLYVAQQCGRNHIRIEMRDSTVHNFKLVSSSSISATVDRLQVSPAASTTINPQDVAQISYVQLMRLTGDAVELLHWTHDVTEVEAEWQGFVHDL